MVQELPCRIPVACVRTQMTVHAKLDSKMGRDTVFERLKSYLEISNVILKFAMSEIKYLLL